MKLTFKNNKKSSKNQNQFNDSFIINCQYEISNMLKLNNNNDTEYSNDNSKIYKEFDLINKKLPKELLIRIFSFLDIITLCRCAQVCKVIFIA